MMSVTVSFKAKGHSNVRSKHKTTFMTTTEPELSVRGDCIIVVSADLGLKDIPDEAKQLARQPDTEIVFKIDVDGLSFEAKGQGHPELEYTDLIDMVARRSNYTCGRTLMINSDKTSLDIPDEMVKALQNPDAVAEITLTYTKNTVSP